VRRPAVPRRYQSLRAKWGTGANRNFFLFFQFQAAFVVFFSIPFAFIALESESGSDALVWTGIVVWAIGNLGTIVSDRQLATWRADSANKGKTARLGLWSWSRHPNYFFEWINWCGIALVASATPSGWIAWIAPSALPPVPGDGYPATEAQAPESCRLCRNQRNGTAPVRPPRRRTGRRSGVGAAKSELSRSRCGGRPCRRRTGKPHACRLRRNAARAAVIFDGVALAGPTATGVQRFKVTRYRKSRGPAIVRVQTGHRVFADGSGSTTSVSIVVRKGQRWRIFARGSARKILQTSVCDGSRRL
jgi:hypothetical protein